MKRPAFQFYPGDWRSNAKLRRCSFAERGIWLEVMCLLHDSDEYGVLRWPLDDVGAEVPPALRRGSTPTPPRGGQSPRCRRQRGPHPIWQSQGQLQESEPSSLLGHRFGAAVGERPEGGGRSAQQPNIAPGRIDLVHGDPEGLGDGVL